MPKAAHHARAVYRAPCAGAENRFSIIKECQEPDDGLAFLGIVAVKRTRERVASLLPNVATRGAIVAAFRWLSAKNNAHVESFSCTLRRRSLRDSSSTMFQSFSTVPNSCWNSLALLSSIEICLSEVSCGFVTVLRQHTLLFSIRNF